MWVFGAHPSLTVFDFFKAVLLNKLISIIGTLMIWNLTIKITSPR